MKEFSSKVKDILIELREYTFHHNPFDMGYSDSRFVGRKRIIAKLKAIFTNSETKSGSYLITGFRGMGKTSLINRVLTELNHNLFPTSIRNRLLRIWMVLSILALVDVYEHMVMLFWLPLTLFGSSFYYLVMTDFRKNTLRVNYIHNWWASMGRRILGTLMLDKSSTKKRRYRDYIQDFYLISLVQVGAILIHGFTGGKLVNILFTYYVLLAGVVLLSYTIYHGFHDRSPSSSAKLWHVVRDFWMSLKMRFGNSNRVVLRINLSYDELKELDVLRLTTRKILDSYKYIKGFSLRHPMNLPWRLGSLVGIYFLVGLFYYVNDVYELNNDLKTELRMVYYFPSQAIAAYCQEEYGDGKSSVIAYHKEMELFLREGRQFNYDAFTKYLEQRYGELGLFAVTDEDSEAPDKNMLREITVHLDFYVHAMYYHFLSLFSDDFSHPNNGIDSFLKAESLSSHFRIIPIAFDYLFLIYFAIVVSLIGVLNRIGFLGFSTHAIVYRRLRELNDRLNARVEVEHGQNVGIAGYMQAFGFMRKRAKHYPIADPREAEAELLEILDHINRIPAFAARPEFVVIYDELDKIEPHQNSSLNDRWQEDTAPEGVEGTEHIQKMRQRQERIFRILANLKHFLNTAKAKFIFIAGREMYDASLADISDRDYFLESIFHDIIYVNSFLTDESDAKKSDVTSMTEGYVCQLIIPPEFPYERSLKGVSKYLQYYVFKELAINSPSDNRVLQEKRRKVIFTLQNFITYLTYRSSGSPKKVVKLMEHYIEELDKKDLCDDEKNIIVGFNHRSLYFNFSFYDQYTFGLVSHLTLPFMVTVSKYMKDFGDKLHVSSSFLMDHIFKFHGAGFAWRNLELTPEIIDINKAPELREFIGTLVEFLKRTHMEEIVSGLYDFKFTDKIDEEIQYVSKISERESAAFNFTLDESQPIKKFYNTKLERLQKRFANTHEDQYVNSIGLVRMILGDLHYYDGEYDDAIIHYRDAIQSYQPDGESLYNFILMLRNSMKLGMAFEKKGTDDSAFMIYSQCHDRVMANAWKKKPLKLLAGMKDIAQYDLLRGAFAGIRLVYQPLVARLFVMEKNPLEGVKEEDIEMVERHFSHFEDSGLLSADHSFLVEAEFRNKLGDLLYYKNYSYGKAFEAVPDIAKKRWLFFNRGPGVHSATERTNRVPLSAYNFYKKSLIRLSDKLQTEEAKYADTSNPELSAVLRWLSYCFQCRKESYNWVKENSMSVPFTRRSFLESLANNLSDLGDAALCILTNKASAFNAPSEKDGFIASLHLSESAVSGILWNLKYYPNPRFEEKDRCIDPYSSFQDLALYCYYLATVVFKRAGVHNKSAFQRFKILNVFNLWLTLEPGKASKLLRKHEEGIEEILVNKGINEVFKAYDHSDRAETNKYRQVFGRRLRDVPNALSSIASGADAKEMVIQLLDVKLKLGAVPKYQNFLVSPYTAVSSKSFRIKSLFYKVLLNERTWSVLDFEKSMLNSRELHKAFMNSEIVESIASIFGAPKQPKLVFEFLINDSIFCLNEIIRTLKIFGTSYLNNYSTLALAHHKQAKWCSRFDEYEKMLTREERIRMSEKLTNLVGRVERLYLSRSYNLEMARSSYFKCIETHSEGTAYKELIRKKHYLDDDFNGDVSHFYAAVERCRINTGWVDKQIVAIKKELDVGATMHEAKNYYEKGNSDINWPLYNEELPHEIIEDVMPK